MKRTLFTNMDLHPPIVTSVINPLPQDGAETAEKALKNGSDALIFQLERLAPEHKNRAAVKKLFAPTEGYPIMVTNYAMQSTTVEDDDSLLQLLLVAAEEGASCIDIRADFFDRGAKHEISFDENAIAKQKEIIDLIHSKGAQVIMSMHVAEFLDIDTILRYGKALESRGADIVKIVDMADTPMELAQSFVKTAALKEQINTPILHLVNGECRELHRLFCTHLGSCLTFCVEDFIEGSSSPSQPLVTRMLKARELDCYKPCK